MAGHKKKSSFNQPEGNFKERIVINDEETIEYLPGYKYRVWHNNQSTGYAEHSHSAIEIILCKSNVYTVTMNHETIKLKEGDILFIPFNTAHQLIAPDSGERFILLFDTDFINQFKDREEILDFYSSAHLVTMNLESHIYPFVYSGIMKIIQAYFSNEKLTEVVIYSELLKIINLMCGSEKELSEGKESSHSDIYDKFVAVLSYIDTNYSEDLSLESVADTAGFSKFHFSRLFKQYTNTTFYDYLCTKRVTVAKQMLRNNIPVTEVAFQTGFNNLTTFCRCFKKYVGCSPSQYKADILHNNSLLD